MVTVADGRSKPFGWALSASKLKYVFLATILAICVATPLSMFSLPEATNSLVWPYLFCILGLICIFLRALFKREWKEMVIVSGFIAATFFWHDLKGFPDWLTASGFRIHAGPLDRYLDKCKLIPFVENGVKQSLGRCEYLVVSDEELLGIYYDSTGELMLPASQRTAEWRAAISHFDSSVALRDEDSRAWHIDGNFYSVTFNLSKDDLGDELR